MYTGLLQNPKLLLFLVILSGLLPHSIFYLQVGDKLVGDKLAGLGKGDNCCGEKGYANLQLDFKRRTLAKYFWFSLFKLNFKFEFADLALILCILGTFGANKVEAFLILLSLLPSVFILAYKTISPPMQIDGVHWTEM